MFKLFFVNHTKIRIYISNKGSRLLNKLFANFFNYFWLPCPLCGENFGGHEWNKPNQSIMTSWSSGDGVCPNCIPAAIDYNKKWIKENPQSMKEF